MPKNILPIFFEGKLPHPGDIQNGHRLKRPQSNTKTATFNQQVKSHLVIKFLQLQQKS